MSNFAIVLPVYNTAKYLEECLDSIIAQTYRNFVIFAVDDGSTDDSLEILRKYQQRDSRIKLITQDNQGVSAARNAALRAISLEKDKPKYVLFFDSDDKVDSRCLEICNDEITNTNLDCLIFCWEKFTTKKHIPPQAINTDFVEMYLNQEQLTAHYFHLNEWSRSTKSQVYALYNKCLPYHIIENVFFDTKLAIAEDQDFFIKLLPKIKSAKIVLKSLYFYRLRQSSLTHSSKELGLPLAFYVYQKHLEDPEIRKNNVILQGVQHRYIKMLWNALSHTLTSELPLRDKWEFYSQVISLTKCVSKNLLLSVDKKRINVLSFGFLLNLLLAYLKTCGKKRKNHEFDN